MATLKSANSCGRPVRFGGGDDVEGAVVVSCAMVGGGAALLLPPQPTASRARTPTASMRRMSAPWRANVCSPILSSMPLRLDAADRLVELVEKRRGRAP